MIGAVAIISGDTSKPHLTTTVASMRYAAATISAPSAIFLIADPGEPACVRRRQCASSSGVIMMTRRGSKLGNQVMGIVQVPMVRSMPTSAHNAKVLPYCS